MKIDILGTEYTILFDCDEEILPEGADGCMDQSTKQIKIGKLEADRSTVQNIKAYRDNVLRHEIIHAFLYESGLWANSGSSEAWGQDETITDWIAIQFPKILKAFVEADCLGVRCATFYSK